MKFISFPVYCKECDGIISFGFSENDNYYCQQCTNFNQNMEQFMIGKCFLHEEYFCNCLLNGNVNFLPLTDLTKYSF